MTKSTTGAKSIRLCFFDSNVLLYSISKAPDEARHRRIATELLAEEGGALSVQVLQEFYVQATRQGRAGAISHSDAVGLIQRWTRFPVQDLTLSVIMRAFTLKDRYGFSYWDAAVISAAEALGCNVIYTEDMASGQSVEGIRIIDPFL